MNHPHQLLSPSSSSSSLISTSTDTPAFKSGYLKRKGIWGKWKDGWYEITNGILYRYSDPKDMLEASEEYALKGCIVQQAENLTGVKNTFLLVLNDHRKKSQLFFQATTPEECADWISIIQKSGKAQEGRDTSLKSRFLLEAFNDAVVLTDERANIIDLNQKAVELFGWRLEEVVGKSVNIFMPQSSADHHPRYVDKYNQTGEKRLIGKPRRMIACNRAGENFPIILSLGELLNDGPKKYIATMKDLRGEAADAEKMTEGISDSIDKLCVSLKQQVLEAARAQIKADENLKIKMEDLRFQIKQLRNELHDVTSHLQLEKATHKIVSNALYSVIRSGLQSREEATCPFSIVKKLAEEQIMALSNPETLFREDSESTRKILAFLSFEGASYLIVTLERSLQKISASASTKELTQKRIIKYSSVVVDAILNSQDNIPDAYKHFFQFLKQLMIKKGWEAQHKVILGGMLFLRFFNPIIISPSKYGLAVQSLNESTTRILITISKVLMALSGGSLPEDQKFLQPLIDQKKPDFHKFVDYFFQPVPVPRH